MVKMADHSSQYAAGHRSAHRLEAQQMKFASLHGYLEQGARDRLDQVAVEEPGGARITYRDLVDLSDRLRDRLAAIGIQKGDRVGICMKKSIDAVASIFGILKIGAAHVPLDPTAPASRNAYIHDNCGVKVVIIEERLEKAYREEFSKLGSVPPLLVLDGVGGGAALAAMLDAEQRESLASSVSSASMDANDLAYILYTSGSTGKPKGVMLSLGSAMAFIDWCSDIIQPRPDDRFANHAPFHFDISVLDLYTSIKHGATLVLVSEEIGKEPVRLAKLIADERISIWYSAPSILALMAQYGQLKNHDYCNLRLVLFAGEVFPVVHLRSLWKQIPHPRYFNLYGPTETNVCTYFEVPRPISEDRTEAYPIGRPCAHYEAIVIDSMGHEVPFGSEGELVMSGPGILLGYWNLPERTAEAFVITADGRRWYKTGDVVIENETTGYRYVGRRDRMVKRRGYRVELGEIEACLYKHGNVREAVVVAVRDETEGLRIKAHLATRDDERISILELKKFCHDNLPSYMIPDMFVFHPLLPKTSTDKIDYQSLQAMG